jgi:hypothetical protein
MNKCCDVFNFDRLFAQGLFKLFSIIAGTERVMAMLTQVKAERVPADFEGPVRQHNAAPDTLGGAP